MAKKNNLKSIRLSDEVMEYILSFEGNGFNQKLENLVLFCMKEESVKRAALSRIQAEKDLAYSELTACRQLEAQVSRTIYLMKDVENQFNVLNRIMYDMHLNDQRVPKDALPSGNTV